jgi:hypothetical protein
VSAGDGWATDTDPPFSMVIRSDGEFGTQPAVSFESTSEPGPWGCRNAKLSPASWPSLELLAVVEGWYACTRAPGEALVAQVYLVEVGVDSVTAEMVVWSFEG